MELEHTLGIFFTLIKLNRAVSVKAGLKVQGGISRFTNKQEFLVLGDMVITKSSLQTILKFKLLNIIMLRFQCNGIGTVPS